MTPTDSAPLIAVINTSAELVGLLRETLEEEGFRTAGAYVTSFKRGEENLNAFLHEHDPNVILWDVALPYRENWAFFQALHGVQAFQGRAVVLTTTNKRALEELVGPTAALEIVGKPFDLNEITSAVRQALVHEPGAPSS